MLVSGRLSVVRCALNTIQVLVLCSMRNGQLTTDNGQIINSKTKATDFHLQRKISRLFFTFYFLLFTFYFLLLVFLIFFRQLFHYQFGYLRQDVIQRFR